ncbi:hypothetical protein MHYP_G00268590 [Metynnis hypsauchen]
MPSCSMRDKKERKKLKETDRTQGTGMMQVQPSQDGVKHIWEAVINTVLPLVGWTLEVGHRRLQVFLLLCL